MVGGRIVAANSASSTYDMSGPKRVKNTDGDTA
jgi:hypothetical protein